MNEWPDERYDHGQGQLLLLVIHGVIIVGKVLPTETLCMISFLRTITEFLRSFILTP